MNNMYCFTYGMLCNPEYMSDTESYGVATLPNYKLEIRKYANVIRSSGGVVYGCLWGITKEKLRELDVIENYPHLYIRNLKPVTCQGVTVRAWVYLMTPLYRKEYSYSAPRRGYIGDIRYGYSEGGVPHNQLDLAIRDLQNRINTQS